MPLTEADVAAHLDKLPPALRAAIEGLEHENEKLRAAAMDAARERDQLREARDYHCNDAANARGALALAEEDRGRLLERVERLAAENGIDASRAEAMQLEVDRAKAEAQRAEQDAELAKDELATLTAQLDETLNLKDELHRQRQQLRDELAALTVRFDETAAELAVHNKRREDFLRESDAGAWTRVTSGPVRCGDVELSIVGGTLVAESENRALTERDLSGVAYWFSMGQVSYDVVRRWMAVTGYNSPESYAIAQRQAAYDLIEREWADLHITQALRVPSAALAWYVNGFCAPDRTLFGAVETWRELQEQKGDKEP